MGGKGKTSRRAWRRVARVLAGLALGPVMQGCALYTQLMQHGGSLPLGDGGPEWTPAVTTPAGGAIGVQIIHRF